MSFVSKQMYQPTITEVSGVDHPAHTVEGWLVAKSRGRSMTKLDKSIRKDLAPEALAYIESLETEVAKSATATPTDAEMFEKALVDLPKPLRQAMLKQQKEAVEARELAKNLYDEREDAKYTEFAKSLRYVPGVGTGKEAALTPKALRKMAEADPKGFEALKKTLTASNEALAKSGLFSELGSSLSSEGGESAMAKVTSMAKALQKDNPKLTDADAIFQVAQSNPDLYAQYRKEQ